MNKAENEVEEVVVSDTETQVEETEVVEPEKEEGAAPEAESDEVVVSIGEESPASDDAQDQPGLIGELRRLNREKDKELRRLRETQVTAPAQPQTLGEKPTLEGCDFDADKFESELESWHSRKRVAEQEQAQKEQAAKAEREAWQARVATYGKQKADIKVADFADAEELTLSTLSTIQQGVMLSGADNPALIVYALGKNPKKAQELAAIKDPVKFAFAVAKLETQLKVTPRRSLPPPEEKVSGTSRISGSDAHLAKLEAAAEKSGDRTKVIEYKRGLKAKT